VNLILDDFVQPVGYNGRHFNVANYMLIRHDITLYIFPFFFANRNLGCHEKRTYAYSLSLHNGQCPS
jgi:hypothetical protein